MSNLQAILIFSTINVTTRKKYFLLHPKKRQNAENWMGQGYGIIYHPLVSVVQKIDIFYWRINAFLALLGRPLFLFCPMGTSFASDGGLQNPNLNANPKECLQILCFIFSSQEQTARRYVSCDIFVTSHKYDKVDVMSFQSSQFFFSSFFCRCFMSVAIFRLHGTDEGT